MNSEHITSQQTRLMQLEQAPHVYEARKRRVEWPDAVRLDHEVKALDEQHGEWILCRTCAEHYEKTQRGRKPNDPDGFKVKMNGRFQEAAWIAHKSRVGAHKLLRDPFLTGPDDVLELSAPDQITRGASSSSISSDNMDIRRVSGVRSSEEEGEPSSRRKRSRTTGPSNSDHDDEDDGSTALDLVTSDDHITTSNSSFFMDDMVTPDDRESADTSGDGVLPLMHLPRSGWRCPGIVPDGFYHKHADLVHAFAKFYVGSYRVNVVRDIRSDKVMLFAHDCENRIVRRERPSQPISCEKCYSIWLNNKSFKRILKKMDRYCRVEDILRHSWSINEEELDALSKFKHSSGANLNVEGRILKQAAMAALKRLAPQREAAAMWKARNRVDESVRSLNASISLPVLDSVMQEQNEHEHSTQEGLEHDALATHLALQTPPESNQSREGAEV